MPGGAGGTVRTEHGGAEGRRGTVYHVMQRQVAQVEHAGSTGHASLPPYGACLHQLYHAR